MDQAFPLASCNLLMDFDGKAGRSLSILTGHQSSTMDWTWCSVWWSQLSKCASFFKIHVCLVSWPHFDTIQTSHRRLISVVWRQLHSVWWRNFHVQLDKSASDEHLMIRFPREYIPWPKRRPFLQQKVVIYLERISFINLAMYGLALKFFGPTRGRLSDGWAACRPCYSFAPLLQLFDYRWSSGAACIDVSKRTCWPHFFKSRNRWVGSSVPLLF